MPAKTEKRTIRRSTNRDLQAIHKWLVDQGARNVEGNFLCNWKLTKESHEEGNLLVCIDSKSGTAVAYQWGGLIGPGILEVRHDMRRKGIGRQLVEHRIGEAYESNQCCLYIQCKPSSSIPFWKRMGFTLLKSTNEDHYAYRILERKHNVPAHGTAVDVAIHFYPEDKKWDANVPAYRVARPLAVRTSDGIIHLNERVFFFEKLFPDCGDPVVAIEIAGQPRYCDKAKYPGALHFGVRPCSHGFYIDQLSRL